MDGLAIQSEEHSELKQLLVVDVWPLKKTLRGRTWREFYTLYSALDSYFEVECLCVLVAHVVPSFFVWRYGMHVQSTFEGGKLRTTRKFYEFFLHEGSCMDTEK